MPSAPQQSHGEALGQRATPTAAANDPVGESSTATGRDAGGEPPRTGVPTVRGVLAGVSAVPGPAAVLEDFEELGPDGVELIPIAPPPPSRLQPPQRLSMPAKARAQLRHRAQDLFVTGVSGPPTEPRPVVPPPVTRRSVEPRALSLEELMRADETRPQAAPSPPSAELWGLNLDSPLLGAGRDDALRAAALSSQRPSVLARLSKAAPARGRWLLAALVGAGAAGAGIAHWFWQSASAAPAAAQDPRDPIAASPPPTTAGRAASAGMRESARVSPDSSEPARTNERVASASDPPPLAPSPAVVSRPQPVFQAPAVVVEQPPAAAAPSRLQVSDSKAKEAAGPSLAPRPATPPRHPDATNEATPRAAPPASATQDETDGPADVVPSAPPSPFAGLAAAEFDAEAAKRALGTAAERALSCRQGNRAGESRVQLTFAPSGRVESASLLSGPFVGTTVGDCALGFFRNARVPRFVGNSITVTKTFTIP